MPHDPKHAASIQRNPQELWNEIALTRSGIDELLKQGKETGDLQPVQTARDELQLKTSNYEKLVAEMQAPMKGVLGRNFLGTTEWKEGFGVTVGAAPPLPGKVTADLLNSDCPLHPGRKIKDTHILMLIPKTVEGQPYSALKLAQVCATRIGSGKQLLDVVFDEWKTWTWAAASPLQSEWVLLPRIDPHPYKVPQGRHFRDKSTAAQAKVYKHYAAEYRQAHALEVMTGAILNDAVNGEKIWSEYFLRTKDQSGWGSRVVVGYSNSDCLKVLSYGDAGVANVGGALARKL